MNRIQKISQIGVPVKDIERAVAFYKDLLGLPLLFSTGAMAFFDCNGVRLLLSLPEKEQYASASSVIYFQVEDIHGKYRELVSNGVTFLDEPHVVAKMGQTETWMTFFSDPEDNIHAFTREVEA
jgi:methylmalonyl-CoA/ethylmalonyl-CoA epimerase